jgi:rhamnogalacturonyl hydrolase YesR
VNEWQKDHPVMPPGDRNWQRATWYTGITAAWKSTGDRRFLEQAAQWGARHAWQPGTEPYGMNRLFCSQTWLELYFLKKDPAMIRPTVEWLDTSHPLSPGGARRWYLEADYGYVDTIYGAPTLAMLARATGNPRYLEIMHAFFEDITGELLDKEAGLYYRDRRFIGKKTAAGKKILWSRGNGWAFAGIARVLDYLPPRDPSRPRYEGIFRRMAVELVKRQGADGMWRPNLDDPEHIAAPESSGTGFFCFGLAWGIRNGLLERGEYLPAAATAWQALVRNVSAEGKVRWGQQVSDSPKAVGEENTHEYVTGAFLLAASEIYALAAK